MAHQTYTQTPRHPAVMQDNRMRHIRHIRRDPDTQTPSSHARAWQAAHEMYTQRHRHLARQRVWHAKAWDAPCTHRTRPLEQDRVCGMQRLRMQHVGRVRRDPDTKPGQREWHAKALDSVRQPHTVPRYPFRNRWYGMQRLEIQPTRCNQMYTQRPRDLATQRPSVGHAELHARATH